MTHRCFDQNRADDTDSGCLPAVLWEVDTVHVTLLRTGKAQVAGGRDTYSITSYSRLYDSATNSWPFSDASAMNHVREFHTATLLPNGQVLVAWGFDGSTQLASAELYTP